MSKIKPSKSRTPVYAVDLDGVMVPPLAVTREQAADLLNVDVQTIDRAIKREKLRAFYVLTCVRIRFADILAMRDANPVAANDRRVLVRSPTLRPC